MKYTGIQLMESAPVSTAIIRLSLPMMAAMLAQSIHSMIDMFFIGKTGDPNMIAAVSLVFPVFMLSQAFGNVFAIGSSSYISRLLGLKNTDESKYTSSVCFYLSLITGVLFTILLLLSKTFVLNNIGASEGTYNHADNYYSVVVLFMPFAIAGTFFSGILRSEGATDKAMKLQLAGIIVNIILTPIFILVLRWGTRGAAWSTIIGQLASFIYGIVLFIRGRTSLSISLKNYKPNKTMLKEVLFIGVPAGFSSFLMSISVILCNRIASSYGDHVVAGFGIQMRIASLCFMFVLALTMGYQPFAGFNFSAKNYERLKKGFIFTIISSSILCIIGCFIFLFFGDNLIRIFIDDEQTINAGAVMLRAFVFGLLFIGIQVTLMETYQALGKALEATLVSLGRQLLFFVPLLYILNNFFGFNGFIFTLPVSDFLTAVLALLLSRSFFKLIKRKK